METPHFGFVVLLATLINCSGGPQPDDVPAASGSGAAPAIGGGLANAAGAGSGPTSGGSGGTPVGSSGAAGLATGGTASASGQPIGGSSVGGTSGGVAAGGAPGAVGVGGASVDPALLPSVTLHLAGDSTVMTYADGSAQEGWGQELPQFLLSKVSLDNQALGGSSVQTFYTGRWQNILGKLKAGDYVMAAFGANDSGSVEGRHVDPPDFQAQFAKMAAEVQAKQATFIAVTPSALQEWTSGMEGNKRLGPYVTVLHTFATEKPVPLVDLNARSIELLNQVGQTAAKDIYINGDKAHFTKQGATQMAELVAHELTRIKSALGAYVK